MCRTEQVVDGLDGVECRGRHFYEYGVPVAHCSVPEARELKGAQFAAAERFLRDKAGGGVYIFAQVVAAAVGVLEVAYEVYGVEVAGALHHLGVLGFGEVDLC